MAFRMDSISEDRLKYVVPLLATKVRDMALTLSLDPSPVHLRVTQGLRTWSEQAALYAQGRSAPGAIVTNAEPGHGWHEFGLAVDVVPFGLDGQPDWNRSHPIWRRLIQLGHAQGLVEGAEFRTFPDYPHFQLTGRYPVSPNDEVRETFHQSGLLGVWQGAGLVQALA
jgi:peptidoglycan L-alanyl-D-glutamate endopeptidase CwlK